MHRSIFVLLMSLCCLNSCYYDNAEDLYQFVQPVECNTVEATYQNTVVPILDSYCIRCHRDARQDGNVNLQGYNNAKSYANDGSLLGSMNHEPGFSPMPSSGGKVPACEIEAIRLWVTAGAQNN